MSDNWLKLVPTDPTFQPSKESAEKPRTLYASFVPRSDEIELEFTDNPEFVPPMGNWSGVTCPSCGTDAEPWWYDAMEKAYESRFTDLEVTVPCCNARLSLNDLNYIWPAAFARFVISARNPRVKDLSPLQIQELESCLATRLRKIWVHL